MFKSLTDNAMDFINSSILLLNTRPKNSLIDFYTAIELFLKGRLMAEHWTLILNKMDDVNIRKFQEGDFYSISLDKALARIESILNEQIDQKTKDNFKTLGEHRNQIVHFAHTDYLPKIKAKVTTEQCLSWFYLYNLLTGSWSSVFKDYQSELKDLDRRIRTNTQFIDTYFNELKDTIAQKKKDGITIKICPVCNKESAKIIKENAWGEDYYCLVCDSEGVYIKPTKAKIKCPKCNHEFEFFNKSTNSCPSCKVIITTDDLINQCNKFYPHGDDWCEKDKSKIYAAYCHVCQAPKPTVFFIDNLWSCVSCFDRGYKALPCPHCDEFVTSGDLDLLKHVACHICEHDCRKKFLAELEEEL